MAKRLIFNDLLINLKIQKNKNNLKNKRINSKSI